MLNFCENMTHMKGEEVLCIMNFYENGEKMKLDIEITKNTGGENSGDGGLDFTKVVYVSDKKKTIIEGYFLDGYDKETAYGNDDILTTINVMGRSQKVISAKKIITSDDKKNVGSTYSYYDKIEDDILVKEMEASKLLNADGRPTVNQRSNEIFVPFFVTYARVNKIVKDDKGVDKIEVMEYTPNIPVLLGMPCGDLFFQNSPSGIGKDLKKFFTRGFLEKNKIRWTYGELEDLESLKEDTKEIQKEVAELRRNKNLKEELFGHLLPISYAQWYEETQGKKYYSVREKEAAAKKGISLNTELPKSVVVEEEEVIAPPEQKVKAGAKKVPF